MSRTSGRNPNVADFAAQLQAALEEKGARKFAPESPESAALGVLRDVLFANAPAPAEDGRKKPRSAMRAWMGLAKLGDRVVFYDLTRAAIAVAASDFNKKIITSGGTFLFGGSVATPEIATDGLLVTIVEDEHGNKLPDAGPAGDSDPGRSEGGLQEEGAGPAP